MKQPMEAKRTGWFTARPPESVPSGAQINSTHSIIDKRAVTDNQFLLTI
ncbi:hypothetical protein QTL97_16230 [Sporosarcina thermotolerans]|uniref:Uncharacterized protein n=1 Tax=Sporosarcina thermotolerans TaxID=633404 RepID=A0AAW9ABQ5_9BACL|nr:hypothetical protein [Sporosarcina thermotolerans]MDW0118479.1 hypothetical protein [Sporosarcina thermotolerans]